MKKFFLPFLLILLLFSACSSLPDVGDFSLSEKIGESVASSMGLDDLAIEMQALQFYGLYLSYAFYGGYSYETGFSEGQGLRWAYTSEPADGEMSQSEYERVFLKDMGDGTTWWRLAVESDDESQEYEYLMNEESDFLVIRFKDSETGEIVEYIPPEPDSQTSEAEDVPEDTEYEDTEYTEEIEGEVSAEESENYNSYEYNQYSMGEEKITVGAGTYRAEHMVSEVKDDSDPDNPVDLRSDWWITESVPGGVVKYIWLKNTDGSKMNSELMAVLENQKTRMDSY
ncbi:hypothetical protein [Oceanispirochaeta sp.]|jgi:hypothetical protein|uniref:hypothetical protein n=1 Tax=Oceanispirochaeta sp. TaxID=2035350 RepID=UPI0026212E66|nr:hypothetical protein [Oceanispirochaeta sp.]MDA3955403.1 hypothetical protein [Oceanispirochaeta sp.]